MLQVLEFYSFWILTVSFFLFVCHKSHTTRPKRTLRPIFTHTTNFQINERNVRFRRNALESLRLYSDENAKGHDRFLVVFSYPQCLLEAPSQ